MLFWIGRIHSFEMIFFISFILLLTFEKPFYRTEKVNVVPKFWFFICYIKHFWKSLVAMTMSCNICWIMMQSIFLMHSCYINFIRWLIMEKSTFSPENVIILLQLCIFITIITSFYTLIESLNAILNKKKSFFLYDSFFISFTLLLALAKHFYRTEKVNVVPKLWFFICYIKTCLKITGCNVLVHVDHQ